MISEKCNIPSTTKEPLTRKKPHKNPRSQTQSWQSKKLPVKWEALKKSTNWRKLSKLEKQILKLGWPNRYLTLSFSEIATLLRIQRNAAIRVMQKLEKMELLTKKKSFLQRKGGGCTKIHRRNYYVFTDAGKAVIEVLLNRLFPHREDEPQKDLTNVRKIKPSEDLRSQDNFQKQKFLDVKKIFQKYSFGNQISRAFEGALQILLSHPIEKIEKLLKLIRKKLQKGWKLREFWGFFLSQLKRPQKVRSFFSYLANEYLGASSGKPSSLTQGVDSRIIAESLEKLQQTGEMITEGKLSRILQHGTQKVKMALDGICYRSYLGRGVCPQPKAELEGPKEPENFPITKLVKVNAQTGRTYSDEDAALGKDFCMKNTIFGYREVAHPKKQEKISNKVLPKKIRSWVGLLIATLETCKDCESIHLRFFGRVKKSYN